MIPKNIFLYTTFILFLANLCSAQVKIGNNVTNVQNGQILQLEKDGTNGGLKIAEAALTSSTDRTTLSIPVDAYGTLIWNTGNAGLKPQGFYVWNGSEWTKVLTDKFSNIYNEDGSLNGNRIVDLNKNNISFSSTATKGTSHFSIDGATFNINAVDDKVGIKTSNPTEALDVNGNVKINGLASTRMAQLYANEEGKLVRSGDYVQPFLIGELRSCRISVFSRYHSFPGNTKVMTGKQATDLGTSSGESAYNIASNKEKLKFIIFNGLRMDFLYFSADYLRPKLQNISNSNITYTINTLSPVDNYTTGGNTVIAPNYHSFLIDDLIYASDLRTETIYSDITFPDGQWYRITYSAQSDGIFSYLYFTAQRLN